MVSDVQVNTKVEPSPGLPNIPLYNPINCYPDNPNLSQSKCSPNVPPFFLGSPFNRTSVGAYTPVSLPSYSLIFGCRSFMGEA